MNVGIVAALTAAISLLSQRWTGFNSPDSEFYASLALFGSDVADRALDPAYTWTRLGYIAPVRGLVLLFGPWAGFEIWRVLLIAMVVGAVFAVVLIAGRSRVLATVLAALVGVNTLVLAYLGNPYLTGTALAVMMVLFALAVTYLGSSGARGVGPVVFGRTLPRWWAALLSGALVGWLVTINPYTAVLGVAGWLAVRGIAVWKIRADRFSRLFTDAAAAVVGFVVSFGLFLLVGLWMFPGRSWFGTYFEWNSALDYTVFIGDATTWQRDTALLVVVLAIIVSLVAVIAQPRHRWAWAALALSVMNVVITGALMLVMPGPWLEAPHYVALLWPMALMALVLSFTSFQPGTREGKPLFSSLVAVVGIVGVVLALWAGRFDQVLALNVAWVFFIVLVVVVIGVGIAVPRRWNVGVAVLLSLTMAGTFVVGQVWQNGRGNLGIYGQYPFRSAFVDFNFDEQMASKIALQEWLLENTLNEDRIGLWTDVDRLAADAAGMQLWGYYNLVSTSEVMTREESEELSRLKPTVIAMYAPDRAQIDTFLASLPPWALPTDLRCTSAPYLGVGTGEVVLCRVRTNVVG